MHRTGNCSGFELHQVRCNSILAQFRRIVHLYERNFAQSTLFSQSRRALRRLFAANVPEPIRTGLDTKNTIKCETLVSVRYAFCRFTSAAQVFSGVICAKKGAKCALFRKILTYISHHRASRRSAYSPQWWSSRSSRFRRCLRPSPSRTWRRPSQRCCRA